ncbi:MAG: SdpI family protein [Flavobacteriaceae bacterium]
MSHEAQLFWALGYCIFILVLFFIVKLYPPKKINWWYGYRTNRSMKNEEIWKVTQEYSSKKSIQLALLSFLFPPLFYFTFPAYNFLLTVIINSLLIVSVIYFTEKYLKEQFKD